MQHQQDRATASQASRGPVVARFRSSLMHRLDWFLSAPLRQASPSELSRARVLAGVTCVALVSFALYLVNLQVLGRPWRWSVPTIGGLLGSAATLALLRRSRSLTAPALCMCAVMVLGLMGAMIIYRDPYAGVHASVVLAPAFAVYLLGPRQGLLIAGLTIAATWSTSALVGVHSGIHATPTREYMWLMNIAAGMAVLVTWVLVSLHSVARDEAQSALEQALAKLGDSERKLSSLFEHTDDMVCSFDTEGRLVIANTAMRRAYARRFGKEPVTGERLLDEVTSGNRQLWAQKLGEALAGRRAQFELAYELEGSRRVLEASMGPMLGKEGQVVGAVLFSRDITDRKQAELELREMHRTLVDVSRQAGMAEIAIGVIHNVGNALNSVNVSATLVVEGLRKLRIPGLVKVVELLDEHTAELGAFLAEDPRGQQLPAYLRALSEQMGTQQSSLIEEMRALDQSIEHIQSIIRMQQRHARVIETVEAVSVPQLIDEALRLHAVSFERLGIRIEREYASVPDVVIDRHKLLQILVNLLSNARHALQESDRSDRRLGIRIQLAPDHAHLRVEVSDNGVGIAPENLARMFHQGFTTKKAGHGFGLHISALAAREMKARLSCDSAGPGQGATFTIELPLVAASAAA
jgi:PAS domain S-box-containing protein